MPKSSVGAVWTPASWEVSPILYLLMGFAACYTLSRAALYFMGLHAALPFSFVPFLLLVCLPTAIVVVSGLVILPVRLLPAAPGLAGGAACIVVGLSFTYWLRLHMLWLIAAAVLAILTRSSWTLRQIASIGASCLTMIAGYATVWNLNYLLTAFLSDRFLDQHLLSADLAAFAAIGLPGTAEGLYPLWSNEIAFRLLENAYAMLFPQVLIGLMLVSMTAPARTTARWLAVFFGAYAAGLLAFTIVPAVGPPIFAPESLNPEFGGTLTGELMRLMAHEFRQVQTGGNLTGFGYFVAMPSLHVAAAVMVQSTMRPWPWVYWTWAPVTALLILSTVVLGYHYLVDLPAGLALGLALIRLFPSVPKGGPRPVVGFRTEPLDRAAPVNSLLSGAPVDMDPCFEPFRIGSSAESRLP